MRALFSGIMGPADLSLVCGGAVVRSLTRTTRNLAALALVLATTACAGKPVVGVLLPTSGPAASYGASMRNAIELALSDIKEDGSVRRPFDVAWADSASDPATAAREFRRLVSEAGANLVVAGVTSGEAKELLPVMEQTGTICISPSASSPMLTRESRLFYRLFASDELEGRRAGRFVLEDQRKSSVLIYTGDTEHAKGIEPPFRHMFEQSLGGRVVGKVLLSSSTWEIESADLVAAHNPEAVYIIGYADETLRVLRHLRTRQYQGLIVVTSAFYSGELIEREKGLVEGVFFPQPAFDIEDSRPLVQGFVTRYRQAHNQDPDIYAAHAYDALRLAAFVVGTSKSLQTNEIRKTLLFSLGEFPGVTGIIQFNEQGDVLHNPVMYVVKDGQVRNYERERKRIIEEIGQALRR